MMKIGDKTYTTRRPDDLDAQLAATTAQSPDEAVRMLTQGTPIASQVAGALQPFLGKDAPSVPELASAIAADDLDRVRGEVAALYAEKAAAAAPTKAAAANG